MKGVNREQRARERFLNFSQYSEFRREDVVELHQDDEAEAAISVDQA